MARPRHSARCIVLSQGWVKSRARGRRVQQKKEITPLPGADPDGHQSPKGVIGRNWLLLKGTQRRVKTENHALGVSAVRHGPFIRTDRNRAGHTEGGQGKKGRQQRANVAKPVHGVRVMCDQPRSVGCDENQEQGRGRALTCRWRSGSKGPGVQNGRD